MVSLAGLSNLQDDQTESAISLGDATGADWRDEPEKHLCQRHSQLDDDCGVEENQLESSAYSALMIDDVKGTLV
jgi:hypothetical protein